MPRTTTSPSSPPQRNGQARGFTAPPTPMLPPGLHVAPFRSSAGALALIAIDPDGRMSAFGWLRGEIGTDTIAFPGARGNNHFIELPDQKLWDARDLFERHGHPLMPPGIHRAPWRPRFMRDGVVLLAIDRRNRCQCVMEVPGGVDPDGAEIRAQLEWYLDEYDPVVAPHLRGKE